MGGGVKRPPYYLISINFENVLAKPTKHCDFSFWPIRRVSGKFWGGSYSQSENILISVKVVNDFLPIFVKSHTFPLYLVETKN